MKKSATFLCAAALILALTAGACGGGKNSQSDSSDSSDSSDLSDSSQSSQDTREETDLNDLCRQLSEGYYSKNLKCSEESGLSDASLVGADEEKMNEVRYPVPSDGEFAAIYDVSESGILPSNADNSAALNGLIRSLKGVSGLKKLYFPAGVYRFSATLVAEGVNDLYIVGEETTEFMMTEWTEAVKITDCENIRWNNIDFDYLISSTVTGKIVATNEESRTVTVQINDGFDMTNYRYNGGKINYGNYMEFIKDETTGAMIPDEKGMLRYNSTGDQVKMISDGVYDGATGRLTLTFAAGRYKKPELGKTVSVGYTMYEYYTLLIKNCKNFYMESCNVYASLGMTFGCYSSENIYLNRANLVLREGSNKLMTATADGLHTNDCYGDLIVSNSIYENSHDDSINVCTFYKTVSAVSGSVITCNAPNAAANFPTNAGDKIEVYNTAMEVVQTYTVENVANYGLAYEITVDKRVKNVEEGYLVGNLTRTPAFVAENCVFRNKRNRGILCQTQNSEIKNCTFYNVIHGSINLHSSFDGYFNEGLIPRNVAVKNCKFINNYAEQGFSADVSVFRSGGTIQPGTITGINVENNFFSGNVAYGVYFCGAGDCTMKNNLFYNNRKSGAADYRLAGIVKSSGISVLNNFVYFESLKNGWEYLYESETTGTVFEGNGSHNALKG